MKKRDFIFIGVLLAAAAFLWLVRGKMLHGGGQAFLQITVDGSDYGTYNLDENQTIQIQETNVCQIENGKVRMIEADCPDQLCVHFAPIDVSGGTIVCLPNRVVLEILDGEEEVDTIAN